MFRSPHFVIIQLQLYLRYSMAFLSIPPYSIFIIVPCKKYKKIVNKFLKTGFKFTVGKIIVQKKKVLDFVCA